MRLLNVDIENLSQEEILKRVSFFLQDANFHRIATVNPEFLLLGQKDEKFRQALETADLRLADGFGITLAFLFKGQRLKARYPGADLMLDILTLAERQGIGVFLAVRKDGLSSFEEIQGALHKKYPTLEVRGEECDVRKLEASKYLSHLSPPTSHLLFCNFGIPHQELFLESLRKNSGSIRLAMGVGGSFDYLTRKLPRAPIILRVLGLEWLWRLFLQPKRLRRICNATFVFPVKVLLDK